MTLLATWCIASAGAQELAPQVLIQTEARPRRPPPEMRSGPSVGLSAGMATGFGPTIGVPLGQVVTVQLTLLPIYLSDAGSGGSFGLRFQQFLGKNPRTRMYLVEGASATGWNDGWLWGMGIGAGVETRKSWSTGLTKWADISLTALGTADSEPIVLPLPQVGIGWVF